MMTSEVKTHLVHLYIQLNALALGHLTPSIIASQDLESLLLSIKNKFFRTQQLQGIPMKIYCHFTNS